MASTEPISGQLIPTLKGKPGFALSQNPPFHPSILEVGGANKSTRPVDISNVYPDGHLYRGLMSNRIDTSQPGSSQIQYKVNFLYNPSTIEETRALDINSEVLPTLARNPGDPSAYKTGLATTVNFSLLFDRTYELWDKAYNGTDEGTFGCLVDVNAFYNMLGINALQVATLSNLQHGAASQRLADGNHSIVTSGPMSAIPVDLYFGYQSVGALKYFGIVTDLDITYTHFTQKMVPMRVAIGIGFQVYADTLTANAGAQPTGAQ